MITAQAPRVAIREGEALVAAARGVRQGEAHTRRRLSIRFDLHLKKAVTSNAIERSSPIISARLAASKVIPTVEHLWVRIGIA